MTAQVLFSMFFTKKTCLLMPLRFIQDHIDEKVNGFNLKFKEVETNLNAIKEKSGYKTSMAN